MRLAAVYPVTAIDATNRAVCAVMIAGAMQVAIAVMIDSSFLHDNSNPLGSARRLSWANIFWRGYSVFPAASCC